jgi:hypothetical protein
MTTTRSMFEPIHLDVNGIRVAIKTIARVLQQKLVDLHIELVWFWDFRVRRDSLWRTSHIPSPGY